MIHTSGNARYGFFLLVFVLIGFSFASVSAQNKNEKNEFCSQNSYNGDRAAYRELRESTIAAPSVLTVDGKQNGGIRVVGSDRRDVLIRACIQSWNYNSDEAARAQAKNVRIETSPTVRAEGLNDYSNVSVSFEILVPRATNLKLNTMNGGIRISSVEGNINFEAQNGGVYLTEVAGDVRGRTTNGGVHVELTGNGWRGRGLDVETSNGGVNITIPENFAAHIETGTVNGGFQSNVSGLTLEREKGYGWRPARLNKDINGGGAPIRIVTSNGGIRINSTTKTL